MKHIHLSKLILHKILSILAAFSLLVTIFLLTNPEKVSLAVLLVPFLLIGFIVYQTTNLLLDFRGTGQRQAVKKLVAISLAFAVVALLLLASLGQLTIRDSLLVVGFVVLFLFYVARADFLNDKNRS